MGKLAFVIPRYAASIGGGAETLMRSLAIALKSRGQVVDIITTCALDHRTWDNHFTEGVTLEDGLKVHRFSVDQRNISRFIECEQKLAQGFPLSKKEQIDWLRNSVNSLSLYDFLVNNVESYDLFFFAPYLFGTSFWGSLLVKGKAVLVPCLHDEGYAYLPIIRNAFRHAKGVMWNALPEAQLAKAIYNIDELDTKGHVVGMGFDDQIVEEESINEYGKYFLYSGRKESGKGLDTLIRYYSDYSKKSETVPKLILIGSGKIDFLDSLPSNVIDLGFVSEEEKLSLMRNAICLFQPSLNESFSIVLMESWQQGTPVLVNSDCAVTKFHVDQSNGGSSYRSFNSFCTEVTKFIDDRNYRNTCGINGKNFVKATYSWDAVVKRFNDAIEKWIS